MRFVVIYLVLAIIIYVRGICPVIHDRRKRLWCLLAVLPGAFFPSVTRFIGGSMVAPDLPVWVMYAGSIFPLISTETEAFLSHVMPNVGIKRIQPS